VLHDDRHIGFDNARVVGVARTGSRSAKNSVIATCASSSPALSRLAVAWLVIAGSGPVLEPGIRPSGMARRVWPRLGIPLRYPRRRPGAVHPVSRVTGGCCEATAEGKDRA
jgi:hypothetical protein